MQTNHRLMTRFFIGALLFVFANRAFAADQAASAEKEKELIAVLRSDAPGAEKAMACKNLAVHGSAAAVGDLAKLLTDEKLASWARIPLEAIPGPQAADALRQALDSAQGKLLVGVINSIGVRRDASAIESLTAKLNDKDQEVVSAAAVALGKIGGEAAAKSLRQALASAPAPVRSAAAEGCVLSAERFLAEGNAAVAVAMYDEVRKAEVPRQRILEATRGAILARKEEGIPLLVEQLRSPDKALFQIGLTTAREFPGRKADEALAAELERATPERAPLLVIAMADRKDTVILAAVLKAAIAGDKNIRLAAIDALSRVGDMSCVAPLLEVAVDGDADLSAAAKTALAELPGEYVDKEISQRLSSAEGKSYPVLIEIVGQRRLAATPALLKALEHSDKAVRSAALTSLGNTVGPKDLSILINQAVTPKHAEDATIAQQSLKMAAVRMPDREACATELAAALQRAPAATKPILLDILGAVGGSKSLETLAAAAKSNDPELQDVSSKLLGEWMTIDAAPVLLDLAKSAPGEKYQVRALRGYIRIARQFVMPDQQRAEMCEKAFDASRQPAEQKLVLDIIKRYPNKEMLKIAQKASEIPALKEDAAQVTAAINKKSAGK
jgi:HEAT repeat protein